MIHLDKNSRGTILLAWLGGALVLTPLWLFVPCLWVTVPVTVILLIFMCFVTWFFRVPERQGPAGERLVTSVADGKVVIVEKAFEKEYLKRDCIQVSVYMNFFDVHCNFWPVDGEVTYYKYHPGCNKLAFLPKSSDLNEHASSAIRTPSGDEIFFKQIAGTFARRIVCYSEPGLSVTRGKQCGVIKFGSRIDMFLPLDADIRVQVGDLVSAITTVIAVLPQR